MIDFLSTFFGELTRRKVWLFGGIYLALGWVLLQVAVVIEATLSLPGWVDQIVLVLLVLGFPVALLLAWAQESVGGDQKVPEDDANHRPAMSIAILPFTNMSDERELGWVADGISEDLTTLFSMHDIIRVTARNSAFAWKGQSPDIRVVGETLRVRFVIEGSLRLMGDTLRITAQLIDTSIGDHIWAQSYDHAKADLVGMQDGVVEAIVAEAVTALRSSEYARVRQAPREELGEQDICLLADDVGYYPMTRRGLVQSLEILEAAVLKMPNSHEILATLAMNYAWLSAFEVDKRRDFESQADKALRKALRLNATSDRVLEAACVVMRLAERHDEHLAYAQGLGEQAGVFGGMFYGEALLSHGRFAEAAREFENWLAHAGKRNDRREYFEYSLACCHIGSGEFAKAEKLLRQLLLYRDNVDNHILLLIALGHQHKTEQIAQELKTYNSMKDARSFDSIAIWWRRNNANEDYVATMMEGLRLAGLE